MSRYRLHSLDGLPPLADDKNQHFRVVDVVAFEEEDESQLVGLLQVEVA